MTDEQQINTPRKLDLTGIGKIIDVACGGTVCMVLNGGSALHFSIMPMIEKLMPIFLSEERDVFVWGFGILGKGPALEFSRTPVQIPNTLFGEGFATEPRRWGPRRFVPSGSPVPFGPEV